MQTLVVLLRNIPFDARRKTQLHGFAGHGDLAMRCTQVVLGFWSLIIGLHELASVFRCNGLQHQKIESFFLLNGSVRTLHGVALGVRHCEAKLGVRIVGILDGETVQSGVLS